MRYNRYQKERVTEMASNFIARETRVAIYNRDGFSCVYCGTIGSEGGKGATGTILSLDHITPRTLGGALADPTNLVTACCLCNSTRGRMTLPRFQAYLSQKKGIETVKNLSAKVRRQAKKPL